LRKREPVLLIACIIKEIPKITFVFVDINNDTFFFEIVEIKGLAFRNFYAGKEKFKYGI
jgi:hypothetical protein